MDEGPIEIIHRAIGSLKKYDNQVKKHNTQGYAGDSMQKTNFGQKIANVDERDND